MKTSTFWRDNAMPFIEMRTVHDGRSMSYGKHSHDTFSIGAITHGQCGYWHMKGSHLINAGAVVVMNPGEVHACNPIDDAPWSYVMMYVDAVWLWQLQIDLGLTKLNASDGLCALDAHLIENAVTFQALNQLCQTLLHTERSIHEKTQAVIAFFALLYQSLHATQAINTTLAVQKLKCAAQLMDEQFAQKLSLEALCDVTGLSKAHFVRAFKTHYGITPHAYLNNRRIVCAQDLLKSGAPIARTAFDVGFADQPHLQRQFKRLTATTPEHYRQSLMRD